MPRPADLCAVRGCRAARADRALRGSARSASPKLEPSPLGEWSTVESRRAGAQKKKAKGGSNARQIIAPQSLAKLRGLLMPAVAVAAPDPATVDELLADVPTNVLRGALRRFGPSSLRRHTRRLDGLHSRCQLVLAPDEEQIAGEINPSKEAPSS